MELDKYITGMIIMLAFISGVTAGYVDLRQNYGLSDNTFSGNNCNINAGSYISGSEQLGLNTSQEGSGSQDKLSTDALGYAYKVYESKGNINDMSNCLATEYGLDQSLNKFPIVGILYSIMIICLAIAAYRLVTGNR